LEHAPADGEPLPRAVPEVRQDDDRVYFAAEAPPRTSAESTHDTRLNRMAPNTPDQKPATAKPSSHEPTIQNSRPLSTKMKRPSVRMVTGRVSSTSSGR